MPRIGIYSSLVTLRQSYHGYWAEDIWSLNSHFGTEDDLKTLSDELHKRGMVGSLSPFA